jgi:hypothetical protein
MRFGLLITVTKRTDLVCIVHIGMTEYSEQMRPSSQSFESNIFSNKKKFEFFDFKFSYSLKMFFKKLFFLNEYLRVSITLSNLI